MQALTFKSDQLLLSFPNIHVKPEGGVSHFEILSLIDILNNGFCNGLSDCDSTCLHTSLKHAYGSSWDILTLLEMTSRKIMHGLAFWHQHIVSLSGSDFQCNIHIIPVKNEEGIVMMFILNFDYVLEEGSDNSTEKISPTSPTKSDQSEYPIFYALIVIIEQYL